MVDGHSMILVEGIQREGEKVFDQNPFIRQCDINAIPYENEGSCNPKGEITKIRIYEEYDENKDYSIYPAKSYYVDPIKVRKMMDSIENDQEQVQRAHQGLADPLRYQRLGRNHFLVKILGSSEDGDNCAGWCLQKLALAGIGNGDGKPVPSKAAGQCNLL